MWTLSNSGESSLNREIMALGDRILNECTDNDIRIETITHLTLTLGKFPDSYKKAREYAAMLPKMGYMREYVLLRILTGDELIRVSHDLLQCLVYNIHTTIHFMTRGGNGFTADEFIRAKLAGIKFFEALYEDGDMGRHHGVVSRDYMTIAETYANSAGSADDVIQYLELAYIYAEADDKAPKHTLTSLLARTVEFDPEEKYGIDMGYGYDMIDRLKKLARSMKSKCFDKYRDDPRFIEIMKKK